MITAIVCLIALPVDEWMFEPKVRTFKSDDGKVLATVLKPDSVNGRGKITVSRRNPAAVLWTANPARSPHRLEVSRLGHVVTLDCWGSAGNEHALVVYGNSGKILADFKLKDLIPKDEIYAHVLTTISNSWWLNGAKYGFGYKTTRFVIDLRWGKRITVDLASGRTM